MINSLSSWTGVYSDGQSAAADKVLITLSYDGIYLYSFDKKLIEIWIYEKVTAVQPLRPHKPSQIGYSERMGARLYIGDISFASNLLEKAPQLSRKAERRRVLYPMLAITTIITALIALFMFSDFSLARVIASMIPDGVRKEMGKGVVQSLVSKKPYCTQPEAVAIFNKMVDRINQGVPQKNNYSVSVAKLGYVNAFAAPGEQIVISGDLIEFAKSPEEVAGVIAHEMGHGLERHPETGIVRAMGFAAAVTLLTGGSSGNVTEFGSFMLQMKYIRDAEREADRHAVNILEKTGISAQPLADFFSRLENEHHPLLKGKNQTKDNTVENKTSQTEKTDEDSYITSIFSTHPGTSERIKTIKSLKSWATTPLMTPHEWQKLQKICS